MTTRLSEASTAPRDEGSVRRARPRQPSRQRATLAGLALLFGALALARVLGIGAGTAPDDDADSALGEGIRSRRDARVPACMEEGRSPSIWLCAEDIAALPTSGPAWESLKSVADEDFAKAKPSRKDNKHNVETLAAALVYARTGDRHYGDKARDAIAAAMDGEVKGRTLALGRNLVAYVIAVDIMDLRSYDPALERRFRAGLEEVRHLKLSGRTLVSTHEDRPNNWGTHAGASRLAASLYLGDHEDVAEAARVFKGWLGDRSSYDGFSYGSDLSWQADPQRPVGINPVGTTIRGRNVDGVLPEEMRRGGSFRWPPPKVNYVWGGLDGATVQAELLSRAGYSAWDWEDQAIKRAYVWLHSQAAFPATSDNTWQPWLVNHAYGTNFPAPTPAAVGKNMAWTDWTHARTASKNR